MENPQKRRKRLLLPEGSRAAGFQSDKQQQQQRARNKIDVQIISECACASLGSMGCSNSKAAASPSATGAAGNGPSRPASVPITHVTVTETGGFDHGHGAAGQLASPASPDSSSDRDSRLLPSLASPDSQLFRQTGQNEAWTPLPTAATAAMTELEPELVLSTTNRAPDETEATLASIPEPESQVGVEDSSSEASPTPQDVEQTAAADSQPDATSLQLAAVDPHAEDPATVPSTPGETSVAAPSTEPETPGGLAAQDSSTVDEQPSLDPTFALSCAQDPSSSIAPPAARKGVVYKQGHLLKNWRPRYFVLEKGEIRYYLPSSATLPVPKDLKGELCLKNCSVTVEGNNINIFGTEAFNNKGQTELHMSISYPNELAEWVAAIKEHIAYINAK